MKEILVYVIIFANLLSLMHLGLYVVGANVYDIKEFKRKKNARKQPQETPAARQPKPLISIIIPAYNEQLGVPRTLDSIRRSTYDTLEVIVVNDGSNDKTAQVTRDYIASQKDYITTSRMVRSKRSGRMYRRYTRVPALKLDIKLVSQTNQGKGAALNNAIANHVHGDLMMCLDADSLVSPDAIEHAVRHFDNPDIIGIAANVRVMGGDNWLALLQRFEHMIGYRSKKFYTLSRSEFIVGGVASTYRTQIVKDAGMYDTDTQTEDIGLSMKLVTYMGNRHSRIVYAADVVATTEGVQTYKALFKQRYRWKLGCLQNLFKYRALFLNGDDEKYTRRLTVYRLPMALLSELLLLMGPLMLIFITYLSISRHSPDIILGAYVTTTLYTMWTIWPDEHLTNRQKIKMSFQGIYMYLVFYAMDLVQLAAVYRCIRHYKKVTFRTATESTWVSPTRAGAAVR